MMSSITALEMNCKTQEVRFVESESFNSQFGAGAKVGTMTAAMLGPKFSTPQPISGEHLEHYRLICGR